MTLWQRLLDEKDTKSSKRFVTLILTLLYVITSLTILFLCVFIVIKPSKIDDNLLEILMDMIYWDAIIIIAGLGLVTSTTIGKGFISKIKESKPNDIKD